jgi:hypothetical protein
LQTEPSPLLQQWEEKKQSNGDGLLTVSKSDQLKITLPNLKNENKSANRGDYRNTVVANRTVPVAFASTSNHKAIKTHLSQPECSDTELTSGNTP